MKRLGFVVVTAGYPVPLALVDGVLYTRLTATTFRTLGDARRAINASLEYGEQHGCGWDASEYIIIPISELK